MISKTLHDYINPAEFQPVLKKFAILFLHKDTQVIITNGKLGFKREICFIRFNSIISLHIVDFMEILRVVTIKMGEIFT